MASSIRQHFTLLLECLVLLMIDGANWAQLAGDRAQNTASPYVPDQWHRNPGTSLRPMWSARWGHALVVLNQSAPRSYLTKEENSERLRGDNPVLVLLGGDDALPRYTENLTSAFEMGIGSGKMRNDIWIGQLTSGSQSPWRVDDRYFVDGAHFNAELIRSRMSWREATPGRIAPATWPSGPKYSLPLTNDEWIACQDSIKGRFDYTLILPDPSVCDDPPQFCYDDLDTTGCHAQGVWKRDNMWSPRRGLGAAVANGRIFVIGGQAREYARIDDSRLIAGISGQKRIETLREHSTIREDFVLKNDVWSSIDGGVTWELVNPGCKDPQEDILMQTEVWSRNISDPWLPKVVGSIGSKCYRSSGCYGVAKCKALGNTHEKVCVCPMFSPRKQHAVAVQHRFSAQDDGSIFAEDVIYVVGGYTSVKKAFCADRSCGPADGYRLAMNDAWMSTDGVSWVQIKPAFIKGNAFRGRGSHTALVIQSPPNINRSTSGNATADVREKDLLLVFGGETSHPQDLSATYLNDVWQVNLPQEPCCIPAKGCAENSKIQDEACVPSHSDWTIVTSDAEWPERSGHTTVYEPPSSGNSFRHRIYLTGGKNADTVFSDVWIWDLENDNGWRCDFCSEVGAKNSNPANGVFLSTQSLLSEVKRSKLPSLDNNGELFNFTSHSVFPIVSGEDIFTMASEGVITVKDLVSADLYSVLKLRGFDYPGKYAREVPNICLLRAISIAIANKCSIKLSPTSFFHKTAVDRSGQSSSKPTWTLCGTGGETKPCARGDWDGCSPIAGVSQVDVHGLGAVVVPQILQNTSGVLEEIFCSQVPDGRYFSASAFLDSKVVLVGGIGQKNNHLYRDVWTRDEMSPKAFITTKPLSKSPQSQFYFDSSEAGAHVFEYKLARDDVDIIPWTTTTKNLGANVAWLDDKKGGPGKGWYTLYVRAVDPSGNRDDLFSTRTNVHRWYYVPPIPWGAVAGGIIASLALSSTAYYEYCRRKKKTTLQRFQLRRLRRKFKLREQRAELHKIVCQHQVPPIIDGDPDVHRRRSDAMERSSNNCHSSSHRRRSSHKQPLHHRDRSHSHSHSHSSHGVTANKEHSRSSQEFHSRHHKKRGRSNSHSRSKSNHRSNSHDKEHHSGFRGSRRKRILPGKRAEDEAKNRRRRDREKLRRDIRQYD